MQTKTTQRFARKKYGRGWTPSTRQGRLITVIYLGFIIWRSISFGQHAETEQTLSTGEMIQYIIPLILAIISLITICHLSGPTPRRQRGKADNLKQ